MNPWRKFPLLRILIPFAGGILAGIACSRTISFPVWLAGTFILPVAVVVFYGSPKLRYSLRWIPGLVLIICTASIALVITVFHLQGNPVGHESAINEKDIYLGEITEPAVQREKTTKIIARIIVSGSDRKWRPDGRKALLYIRADERSRSLFYGDRFFFTGSLEEPSAPVNPQGFDLRKSCFLKGISLTAFISSGKWIKTGGKDKFSLFSFALKTRDRLLRIFTETGLKGREFAVASALLFGYTDEIDNGLFADFSATGTIHILSVSGMHVGVIFLFLEKVLGFTNRFRHGSRIRSGFIILFIWFYAVLTGLSPAVLRAAAMLTLIILGKNLKRNPDILNILAASAIILLAADPLLVMDIGFELSYLAVAGIVVFYKPIYDLYITSKWLPDKIWALVAVSIAAQMATFPLSLYQFHRFPNYFMIANIIAVPLSTLIIYSGIILLVFGTVPFLSRILAMILAWLVNLLNSTVHVVGILPGSVVTGICISALETILIYGIMAAIFLFLLRKKKFWLFISISLCIALSGSFLFSNIRDIGKRKFVVYSVRKQGLADFICRGESILVGTARGEGDPYFNETLGRYWQSEGVKNKFLLTVFPERPVNPAFRHDNVFFMKGPFIGFLDKRIMVINRKIPPGLSSRMNVDYIILSGNPKVKISEIERICSFKMIIIDGSNSAFRVREWKEEASHEGVKVYSVPESGAFII